MGSGVPGCGRCRGVVVVVGVAFIAFVAAAAAAARVSCTAWCIAVFAVYLQRNIYTANQQRHVARGTSIPLVPGTEQEVLVPSFVTSTVHVSDFR